LCMCFAATRHSRSNNMRMVRVVVRSKIAGYRQRLKSADNERKQVIHTSLKP
jgi:hypothetical protein